MTPSTISLHAAKVDAELAKLDARERAISQRRRELHAQIDLIYLAAPLDELEVARLDRLETAEREVSMRRRRLHAEIDEMRASLGMPSWRAYRELDDAA